MKVIIDWFLGLPKKTKIFAIIVAGALLCLAIGVPISAGMKGGSAGGVHSVSYSASQLYDLAENSVGEITTYSKNGSDSSKEPTCFSI